MPIHMGLPISIRFHIHFTERMFMCRSVSLDSCVTGTGCHAWGRKARRVKGEEEAWGRGWRVVEGRLRRRGLCADQLEVALGAHSPCSQGPFNALLAGIAGKS